MNIKTEKYDQAKVDTLKHFVQTYADKGKPKHYEIFVDTMKVVDKTTAPEDFDNYQDFLNDDTEYIKIVIYNSGASPRNDQYKFLLKGEVKKNEGLNGLEVQSLIQQKLDEQKEQLANEALKAENLALKGQVKEAEEYIEKLHVGIEEIKNKKGKLSNPDIVEFVSLALEGLVRRNTHLISGIPGAKGLAGVIDADTKAQSNGGTSPPETEASFRKKEASPINEINEEDREFLPLLRQFQEKFNEANELENVMQINNRLAADKSQIKPVLELLIDKNT